MKTTTYRIFVALDPGDTIHADKDNEHVVAEVLWEPLGVIEAADQDAALEAALEQAKTRTTVDDGTISDAQVFLTVAAVSERNWREGTACITVKPITTWASR